ncbi:MAG: NHL repeat-containing protein [Phycisphaeraceae bacterium]|nr:NHL repeat-containing protein [Phycisphaerales bacterium]MCB9860928.1 NHL repeat-containing protein [Phycisphaeraceae bacterium]
MALSWKCVGMAVCVAACTSSTFGQSEFLVVDYDGDKIVRYEWPSGLVKDHFVGTGLTNLNAPYKAVYGPDGDLYVSGTLSNNVQKYNGQTGQSLGEIISPGAGGLSTPLGLTFGVDNMLYICSGTNDRVKRWDPNTGVVSDFIVPGNNLDNPHDLAQASNGDWYVTSYNNDRVLRYSASGAYVEDAIVAGAFGLDGPIGCVVDPQNRLFVASEISDKLLVKDLTTGGVSQFVASGVGGLDRPYFLSLGPEPDVLYTVGFRGTAQFLKFNRNTGTFLGTYLSPGTGGLSNGAVAVAFVPDIEPCYADCDNNGNLNIFDYICFGNAYTIGCP